MAKQETEQAQTDPLIYSDDVLNALPVGAVLRSENGGVWVIDDPETDGTELRYLGTRGEDYRNGYLLLQLNGPLMLIWDPRHAAG